ncbi:MAG: SDR family NAD(P)-dependent oxidoreductase [Candidatus Pristimantibacillus sp.]
MKFVVVLIHQLVQDINEQYGDIAIAMKHNVTDEQQWISIIEAGVEKFGKIDILVNNAGVSGRVHELKDITLDEWNFVMNINATSNFLGMKHVVPAMKKVGGGSIVNISSIAGINGYGMLTPYGASKGAANQLGPDKIRVNSVHPGFIDTPMIAQYTSNEEAYQYLLSQIPLRTLGKPVDVAKSVLFLASDESCFITGAELVIDGGRSIKE